jgi:hypothetical protein
VIFDLVRRRDVSEAGRLRHLRLGALGRFHFPDVP